MKQVPNAFDKNMVKTLRYILSVNLKTFATSLHGTSSWNRSFEVEFRDAGWVKNIQKVTFKLFVGKKLFFPGRLWRRSLIL